MNARVTIGARGNVEVAFPETPPEDTRRSLGAAGFVWSPASRVWYARPTPEALDLARSLTERPSKNPRPAAWNALPPGTPVACRSAYVGRTVPGRGGGKVTACATPLRSHPNEGALIVGEKRPTVLPRTVVKTRLRDAKKARCDHQRDPITSAMELGEWLAAKAAGEREGTWIPTPPDYDFPHRAGQGQGCHYSPLWEELRLWLADRWEEGVEGRALVKRLRKHPRYREWVQAEERALELWSDRVRKRRAKAAESTARTAATRRADAIRRGEDVTSAHYLETRRGGEGASRKAPRRKS